MLTLFRDPTRVGVICLAAPERADGFGTRSSELLGQLIPHLDRGGAGNAENRGTGSAPACRARRARLLERGRCSGRLQCARCVREPSGGGDIREGARHRDRRLRALGDGFGANHGAASPHCSERHSRGCRRRRRFAAARASFGAPPVIGDHRYKARNGRFGPSHSVERAQAHFRRRTHPALDPPRRRSRSEAS
jgi:hypothetical protein